MRPAGLLGISRPRRRNDQNYKISCPILRTHFSSSPHQHLQCRQDTDKYYLPTTTTLSLPLLLQLSSLLPRYHLIVGITRVPTSATPNRSSTNNLPVITNKPTSDTHPQQCLAPAAAFPSTRALVAALPAHLAVQQTPDLALVVLLTANTMLQTVPPE